MFGDTQDRGEMYDAYDGCGGGGWSDYRAVLWCRFGSTENVALIFVRKTF